MTALERAVKLRLMTPGEPGDTLTREEMAEIVVTLYDQIAKVIAAMAQKEEDHRFPWLLYR